MTAALKLQQVSLYALPAIRYAIDPNKMSDKQKARKILSYICTRYQVSSAMLLVQNRYPKYVYPRHVAMYAIREKTNMSLKAIGRMFERDHTTVINAVKSINNYIETNETKKDEIEGIICRCLL